MHIITVINAKGGCGKSTIAMGLACGLARRGFGTVLFDMDPQAQVTQWLGLGDGLSPQGTIVEALEGGRPLDAFLQPTAFEHLSFVASAQGLEDLGRQITDREDYATLFTTLLAGLTAPADFVVIDSPNQISPIMENVIYPSDLFLVPFESTKAVRSYANFYQLLLRLRGDEEHRVLHVLSNLSRQRGLRQRVLDTLTLHGIPRARSEIRTCGWLAQVDENGGNIFDYRPFSRGAEDMAALVAEVLERLGVRPADGPAPLTRAPAPAPAVTAGEPGDPVAPANPAGEPPLPHVPLPQPPQAAPQEPALTINHNTHHEIA